MLYKISFRSTPPTSPQHAQNVAHQAECNQHQLDSPPFHRHPCPAMQLPSNMHVALMVSLFLLWLSSTPNIVSMDLVMSFSFPSYLIRITYNTHVAVPMLLFSFHTHASCTPHLLHLRAVHGYVLLSSVSILPPPCGYIMFHFSSISWPCLMHASTSCH